METVDELFEVINGKNKLLKQILDELECQTVFEIIPKIKTLKERATEKKCKCPIPLDHTDFASIFP